MKKFFFAFCILSFIAALSATGGSPAGEPKLTIKLGTVAPEDVPMDKWAHKFGELLAERSNGEIVVEVYPASSLGGNRELCEQLQMGTIEAAITSVAFLGGFTDSTKVLDLPYLFMNDKGAEAVLDGEIGDGIFEELAKQGFVGLGWGCQGWRHLTANKEVLKPEDMEGVKIRVMENPLHIEHFNTLGASAIPMAFSEVFTALQQGAVDAQENPWCNIDANRYYEVQKYIIKTSHLYDPSPMLYSKVLFDQLSPEYQKLILEAGYDATLYERDVCREDELASERKIAALNRNVIIDLTPEQRAAFRAAVEPMYVKYREEIGAEIMDKVMAIQQSAQ